MKNLMDEILDPENIARWEKRKTENEYCKVDKKLNVINIWRYPNSKTKHVPIYWVDLDRCKTAGACLDWIHQLTTKTWVEDNPKLLACFIEILFYNIDGELWHWQN
jgi:hypothetical protein